jgi:hypothetical protein
VVVVAVYDRVPPPTAILAEVAKAVPVKLAIKNKHARRVNIALKCIETFLEKFVGENIVCDQPKKPEGRNSIPIPEIEQQKRIFAQKFETNGLATQSRCNVRLSCFSKIREIFSIGMTAMWIRMAQAGQNSSVCAT